RKSMASAPTPRTPKNVSCARKSSSRSGGPWRNCPWNSERWWSSASWKVSLTRRSPPSRAFPWVQSCPAWPVPASGCINGWVAAGIGVRNLNCRETQTLLHGYVDGELDLMTSLEIGQHLQECPACAPAHERLQAVRAAIKNGSLYYQTSPGLARRV